MASISVQNETTYTVTDTIAQHIRLDVQEHFGDTVSAIRVQEGLARHAFNVRTGEVRYAFSPRDFGLLPTPIAIAAGDLAASLIPDELSDGVRHRRRGRGRGL